MKVTLSRKQVNQLAEIAKRFNDVEYFDIFVQQGEIGNTVVVKCDMDKIQDVSINITDYESW